MAEIKGAYSHLRRERKERSERAIRAAIRAWNVAHGARMRGDETVAAPWEHAEGVRLKLARRLLDRGGLPQPGAPR